MKLIDKALRVGERKQLAGYERQVAAINRFEAEMELLGDDEISATAEQLRSRARDGGESLEKLLPEAFALGREAARRTLGMRHYDVQLLAAIAIHNGQIAEMGTGEGKTLAATLPVFLNSLGGAGVHVVTVNDYLARRDAEWMGPIYAALGVTVGVLQQTEDDPERRRAAYAADVTYGTNSEFGFDYLRDNMVVRAGDRVQRPLAVAIVDEVDNILIDEARTPLIISGAPTEATDTYRSCAQLARTLRGREHSQHESDSEERRIAEADYDYVFDPKHKTVAPTERGVERAERFLGVENLYVAEHGSLVNHLIQALKAESLYRRDKDYAVIEGEVLIIDEHTGRILEGRRWSEGLHQAIEAKEGVELAEEHQTVATITLQNYFRRYERLAGMTGTALTEATEFMKTYGMPVIEVPPNRPRQRIDRPDLIFKTAAGKWKAVIAEIAERHQSGQPILVGTAAVETSELISERLKRAGIKHTVLNAKPEHAEREGEIVAQAGRLGAVTIATNMAGRGVDIKLGGDPEMLAEAKLRKLGIKRDDPDYAVELAALLPDLKTRCEKEGARVRKVGGLYICGTERHESRRIDNQLRGRSGRQGDPGESRFFISAEDYLIKLFAGERLYRLLDRLGPLDAEGEEIPLESKMMTKQVAAAQQKVEQENFLTRKRTLEYDDVLNAHRETIYGWRQRILLGEAPEDDPSARLAGEVERIVQAHAGSDYFEDWDLDGLRRELDLLCPQLGDSIAELTVIDRDALSIELTERVGKRYQAKQEEFGAELLRQLEMAVLLPTIDEHWREHLADIDYLRRGIHLRSFANLDPLVAYKNEAFTLFGELVDLIWIDFNRFILHAELRVEPPSGATGEIAAAEGDAEAPAAAPGASGDGKSGGQATVETGARRTGRPEPGRNEPCWCGSGRKYKRCHGI